MDLEETEARNDCAGEGQQQFNSQSKAVSTCIVSSHYLEDFTHAVILVIYRGYISENVICSYVLKHSTIPIINPHPMSSHQHVTT
jgi:hypothetical protein